MTTETYEAWVLHQQPAGDSSTRVTFFTREKGLLHCYYKGGRTPKKQAIIQPFLSLWLALDLRRDWYYVRNVEMLTSTLQFKGIALFAALYLNELLYYALSPCEEQSELYAAYTFTINALATISEQLAIEVLLRRFELALLACCGYSISFTTEAHSERSIIAEQRYQFVADEGFVLAERGISGESILALAAGRLEEVELLKTAKFIMRKAIDHLLSGRELKSRALFIQLIGM